MSGPVPKTRAEGRGPTIWLAGSPEELEEWMPLGIAGIVTNTVVLNQYAKPYGSVLNLIKKYLEMIYVKQLVKNISFAAVLYKK